MKKFEFSKKLVVWAIVVATLCVASSYILAFLGRETAQDMTVAVVTACTGIIGGYLAKSYGEKASRNKYGLDEDGLPYQLAGDCPSSEEEES